MSEISERYHALSREFGRRVEGVPADRWEAASPCEGWTARDVLRHVIEIHHVTPGSAGVTLPRERSVDDDPVGAWVEARDAMQALLEDPERAAREFDGYMGRTSVEQSVDALLCFDLLVHSWDIARATGQDEQLPPEEVSRAFALAKSFGDAIRTEGVCGPPVAVPDDAPEQDRMIAFLGRTP